MKLLWFTNTPSLAEERLTSKPSGGGWIKSLEKRIKKIDDIELAISFYSNVFIENFEFKGTKYFPIYIGGIGKVKRFFERLSGSIEPDEDVIKFLKIIGEFKPDIIHIHGSEGPFGLIQEHIKNIPVVLSIQGNIIVYHYKWYSGFSSQDVRKYSRFVDKILFKTFNAKYKSFTRRAKREKKIFSLTKYIIGRTDWDRRITSVLTKNAKYFHNDEILRDSFYKKKWDRSLNRPLKIFTTTGNNIYKGIEVVLQSAKLLEYKGVSFKWEIAGLNAYSDVVKLARKAYKLKKQNNIVFLGKLEEEELVKKLLATNIYVMPSHIENSPNALCEAMILGLPCIATCAGGTSSLLSDKKEGLVIQAGDPWALSGAILELFNNYDKAKIYGENARKRALKRHNPEKITKKLLEIYKEILNNEK